MVTYIYFVKCPNCEDEHFDFFDEAKEFALGCLSQKPIITQTEVCRNDFGECTDSADLGTVWSWEDMMGEGGYTDAEPTKSLFTKDDIKLMADGKDPEFDNLDNSLDCEPETSEVSSIERKPIPEGMTIEQLVEEMEENEDIVECTWCEDLFDKSECRYEVDLGWLCSRCEAAIKSRGETLTFRENNYWDFLDEEAKPKTWICTFEGNEIGTVEATNEDEAAEKMQRAYPEYPYGLYDGCFEVYLADEEDLTENLNEELSFSEMVADSINHLINDLGKDSSTEDFADDVIADIENNYDIEVPEDPEKYRDWASAVASEVSRQLNNSSQLDEDIDVDDVTSAETPEVSDSHLRLCPECGKETFDIETGICVDCGFN